VAHLCREGRATRLPQVSSSKPSAQSGWARARRIRRARALLFADIRGRGWCSSAWCGASPRPDGPVSRDRIAVSATPSREQVDVTKTVVSSWLQVWRDWLDGLTVMRLRSPLGACAAARRARVEADRGELRSSAQPCPKAPCSLLFPITLGYQHRMSESLPAALRRTL
jgi:hypothetical protein